MSVITFPQRNQSNGAEKLACKALPSRLAQRRNALGLSEEEVSEATIFLPRSEKVQQPRSLGVNAYRTYEKGDVEPDLAKIEALAKALKTTPEWLAFGVGPETIPATEV